MTRKLKNLTDVKIDSDIPTIIKFNKWVENAWTANKSKIPEFLQNFFSIDNALKDTLTYSKSSSENVGLFKNYFEAKFTTSAAERKSFDLLTEGFRWYKIIFG